MWVGIARNPVKIILCTRFAASALLFFTRKGLMQRFSTSMFITQLLEKSSNITGICKTAITDQASQTELKCNFRQREPFLHE